MYRIVRRLIFFFLCYRTARRTTKHMENRANNKKKYTTYVICLVFRTLLKQLIYNPLTFASFFDPIITRTFIRFPIHL
ncbi:hypothetical protein BDB00DRAFT_799879 [Zychaea mexicana]|uniref:uncharacterized protein n=1 Tax=Zychaea mexicana TaxID=64656 RepID=UPI0022FDBF66|nr:uncharacterized protein BDB00DRAFT_799879 [Zychaea mexicana]KAI9498337.1 hypothetical protein BDB00DRAFT_799879 [Zychaea mexicana]